MKILLIFSSLLTTLSFVATLFVVYNFVSDYRKGIDWLYKYNMYPFYVFVVSFILTISVYFGG